MTPESNIRLIHNNAFKWYTDGNIWVKGYFFYQTHHLFDSENALGFLKDILSTNKLEDIVKELNGIFSIVVLKKEGVSIASDPVNFFPIFYCTHANEWLISDDFSLLREKQKAFTINEQAVPEFLSAGFVLDNETLGENIFKTRSGEILILKNNEALYRKVWYYFLPQKILPNSADEHVLELTEILDQVAYRLVKFLNGRTAVIPLSGGYDSRLIACLLKKAGYEKTICITYGRENPESILSKKVAEALGFRWFFVDYASLTIPGFIHNPEFLEYATYMGNGFSMPYLQEYFAAKYLKENNIIPQDAVFLPGHTGDYIAGSYVRKSAKTNNRGNKLAREITKKYFWFLNLNPNDKNLITQRVNKLFSRYHLQDYPSQAFNPLIEDWDIKEKISKFIFHSSHVFPFFNHQVYFPLWDHELVEFFRNLPYSERMDSKLYKSTLERYYFRPCEVFFYKNELNVRGEHFIVKGIKKILKPLVPSGIRLRKLKQNDWICYSSFTDEMQKDLHAVDKKVKTKKIQSYNAIICRWYIYLLENR